MSTELAFANADMIEGYLDGCNDDRLEFPASLSNRSQSYQHGWLNGRDDRINKPRASADHLRSLAALAMRMDEQS